jgi:hypothetical protein
MIVNYTKGNGIGIRTCQKGKKKEMKTTMNEERVLLLLLLLFVVENKMNLSHAFLVLCSIPITMQYNRNIQGHFVLKFPETSRIINEGLRQSNNNYQLFEGTPFGFSFFSSLGPGAKIAPHNAPTNLRLRIHLPIVVSSSKKEEGDDNDDDINVKTGLPYCGIRVANSIRSYQTNNALVLDDAYDHEVWNDTNETRVVLLVDIWHPDISQTEKEAIVDMFQTAKRDGLWRR